MYVCMYVNLYLQSLYTIIKSFKTREHGEFNVSVSFLFVSTNHALGKQSYVQMSSAFLSSNLYFSEMVEEWGAASWLTRGGWIYF